MLPKVFPEVKFPLYDIRNEPRMDIKIAIIVFLSVLFLKRKYEKMATNSGFVVTSTVEFIMDVYFSDVIQLKK